MVHACNPSTQEVETEGLEIESQSDPWLDEQIWDQLRISESFL